MDIRPCACNSPECFYCKDYVYNKNVDLDALVAKMRELGITEYKNGEIHIVLGAPKVELDERTEEEQQRIRDERERKFLQHKQDVLYRASWGIGPSRQKVK